MKKIMKFEADWCQPCKQLSAWIDDKQLPVDIESINSDTNPEIAWANDVKMLPTMIDMETGLVYAGFGECRRFLEGLL